MIEAVELSSMSDSTVAALLGVTERMIRNYVKSQEMPCIGRGKARRFNWPEVLEWYLGYRVRIADRGGRQRSTLRCDLGNLRNRAASAERQRLSGLYDRRLKRERRTRSY